MQWHRVDWEGLLRWLPVWHRLQTPSRRCLLASDPVSRVSRTDLGDDWEWLLEQGHLFSVNGGEQLGLAPKTASRLKVLRALDCHHELADGGGFDTLSAYLQERFGVHRLHGLAPDRRVFESAREVIGWLGSPRRLRDLLDAPGLSAWYARDGGPRSVHWFRDEGTFLRIRDLARALLEAGGSLTLLEVGELDPGSASGIGRVVAAGQAGAVFLATLGRSDSLPLLALYPPAVRRLCQPRPQPPGRVTPARIFDTPLSLLDLTALLIDFSAQPPRVRRDGELFVRDARRLTKILEALPSWMEPILHYDLERALDRSVQLARELRFVRFSGRGKSMSLKVTREGRQWLQSPARDRFSQVTEALVQDREDRHGLLARRFDSMLWPGGPRHPVNRALQRALAEASQEEFVRVSDFCRYQAGRHNPLLELDSYQRSEWRIPLSVTVDPEAADETWGRILENSLAVGLLPLGGVALGVGEDGQLGFRVTSVGRYLLGQADEFRWDLPEERVEIVVQANFEVVFLAPSASAEAKLERFAQRRGRGVGVLFALTREAVFRAAEAGLTAGEVLDTLDGLSRNEVPANVKRQLSDWFSSCRRVQARQALLIHCPDEETARRVLSVSGGKARLLAADLIELPDRRSLAPIRRKLAAAGIFVN